MDKLMINRRHLLMGLTAASGALVTGSAVSADGEKASNLKNLCGLDAAEHIMGVDFTDAEAAQIYDTIDENIDALRLRRAKVSFDNEDPPALIFDPRLRGRPYPAQENSINVGSVSRTIPSHDEDIAFASIIEQAHWIKTGQLTSLRLTNIYLSRIEEFGPKLECFITVTADLARKQAAKADAKIKAGKYKGLLHGIPYGVKDLADTKDIRTTWGAAPYKDRIAKENAVIVERLNDAGAVMLGKTSLGALAYNDVWFDGTTRNPWALSEGSSGSSAGSASATAAALVGFSIGTETLGSIVSPSTRCGCTGLRPSFGRVPRTGAMALCWSLDKIGPICRYVNDTAAVLDTINGSDNGDISSLDHGFFYDGNKDVKDLRVGYNQSWFKDATDLDKQALEHLGRAGATLVEVDLPDLPYSNLVSNLLSEAAAAFEDLTLSNKDDLLAWQEPQAWPNGFRGARFTSAVEYMQLDRFRRKVMVMMDDLFRNHSLNAMISPNFAASILTITNYTGHPSLTVPIGLNPRKTNPLTNTKAEEGPEQNLPHTITLWGNLFKEDAILRLGKVLEKQANYHKHRPQLI